jgi:RNA polymerase sigma-70 factor (ECF subfamily)
MTREEYNRAVDDFSDAIYRFACKVCRSREIAADVVQDAYMKLWELLSAVATDKARAFLFTTAYRRAVDALRHEKRFVDADAIEEQAGVARPAHVDLRQALDRALDTLPGVQRAVVLLRDYEGYSYREIAGITGIPETSVKVYIFRARVAMRAYIGSPDKII